MAGQPKIYLDYAAATPVAPQVMKAMRPYLADAFYNPSATYVAAAGARAGLDAARADVASHLGARPAEIVFTAGGTEANNLAVQGILRHDIVRQGDTRRNIVRQTTPPNVVVSAIEHESVLGPARLYDHREAGIKADGLTDLEDLRRKIDDHTVLVSIGYANNEIGTVQPLREISRLLREVRSDRRRRGLKQPLYFHTDACQAANYLDLHAARLGVDLMTLNGGKIYGPKQSGILYVKAGTLLEPLIAGGGQERGLRSGTENVAAAAGFAAALDLAQEVRPAETARLRKLQQRFIDGLKQTAPDIVVNGSLKYRLPNNVHITVPGRDNERLLIQLDEAGIMAAAGSACSASDEEPSHVLRAVGLSDADARASLRFTMGRTTTATAVDRTVRTLSRLLSS